ncbi:MAG TPA: CpsD/CapB family tyrosine-protein kinase [Novosphingobium sp.]
MSEEQATTGVIDEEERPAADTGTASEVAPTAPESAAQVHYRISRSIVVLSEPEGERAESIRALRAHLLAGHMAHGRRSLAVCGAGANSGSNFLAVNLAVAFAKADISTLLIDANISDAGVYDFLRPDRPLPGLRDILTGPDGADRQMIDNIRTDVLPNLSVIYSGIERRNSTEVFASRQFKQLIDDCMRDHEITIVNTPAGGGSADVRRIAKSVRYALVVARRNHTLMSEFRGLVEELESDRVNLIGTYLSDF